MECGALLRLPRFGAARTHRPARPPTELRPRGVESCRRRCRLPPPTAACRRLPRRGRERRAKPLGSAT